MLRSLLLNIALFVSATVSAGAQAVASLVLVHGHIWTENPAQPEAEAIAIDSNRILRVGTSAEILRLAGPATRVIDLHGRRVVLPMPSSTRTSKAPWSRVSEPISLSFRATFSISTRLKSKTRGSNSRSATGASSTTLRQERISTQNGVYWGM